MRRKFIITVDTEGDNQWNIYKGEQIKTENSRYIPHFQSLCEEYGLKPVYLINFEMANDEFLISYLKEKQLAGLCEVGTHVHAWNSPPEYKLEVINNANPYITEYPKDIIYAKMEYITELIEKKIGVRPVTHRAGRWATSDILFDILSDLGYIVDCSIVSGCNMMNFPGRSVNYGFDYRQKPNKAFWIREGLLEIPMSVKHTHTIEGKSIKNGIKNLVMGKDVWFRPAISTVKEMKEHIEKKILMDADYVEFMIHSTELMPGGSPYFRDAHSVEKEFKDIRSVFEYAVQHEFEGMTMREYYLTYSRKPISN